MERLVPWNWREPASQPSKISIALSSPISFTSSSGITPVAGRPQVAGAAVTPQVRSAAPPHKFKTEMCRNWEAQGVCTYRGCTFAHEPAELRAPPQRSSQESKSGTSNSDTPVTTRPHLSPPLPVAVDEPPVMPSEQLMELVQVELRKERDALATLQETNRGLEKELRNAQAQRQQDHKRLATLDEVAAAFESEVQLRQQLIQKLHDSQGHVDLERVVEDMMADWNDSTLNGQNM